MRLVGMLLVVAMLAAVSACNSDDPPGASTNRPAFRSLGKRADSDLGAPPAVPRP